MSTLIDSSSDPESIDGSFVPRRDAAVQCVTIDGEAILVDGASGLHVLNPTASLLWECFDGDVTIAELADEIAAEMQVPTEQVLDDSIRVAQEFAVRGIVSDARVPVLEPSDASTAIDDAVPAAAIEAAAVAPVSGPQVLADPPNA
jgi:hypothetical protein